MDKLWCVDIFTKFPVNWGGDWNGVLINGPQGCYRHLTVTKEECNQIIKKCTKMGVKYKCYEKRWDRNSHYRADFFKTNKGPFRCRYCNRMIKPGEMQVDHIIPVSKTRYYESARRLLAIQDIHNVNDVRNLAPSCPRCNKKKGTRIGFWLIRAQLGKYKWYWVAERTAKILFLVMILFFLYGLFT